MTALQKGGLSTAALDALPVYDLVAGLLLFIGPRKFPEQALLGFFQELQDASPARRKRFGVRGSPGRLTSPVLRSVLSFMEM